MPVPKRKRSRPRRDKRFANKGMEVKTITECQNCKNPLNTHVACSQCGYYKGVKVLTTKQDRLEKRVQAKAKKSANRTSEQGSSESE